jgi:hypothetical protein
VQLAGDAGALLFAGGVDVGRQLAQALARLRSSFCCRRCSVMLTPTPTTAGRPR